MSYSPWNFQATKNIFISLPFYRTINISALIFLCASLNKPDTWSVGKCDMERWEFWSIISSLHAVWDGSVVILDELTWTVSSLMIYCMTKMTFSANVDCSYLSVDFNGFSIECICRYGNYNNLVFWELCSFFFLFFLPKNTTAWIINDSDGFFFFLKNSFSLRTTLEVLAPFKRMYKNNGMK